MSRKINQNSFYSNVSTAGRVMRPNSDRIVNAAKELNKLLKRIAELQAQLEEVLEIHNEQAICAEKYAETMAENAFLQAQIDRSRNLPRWTANKISDVTSIDKSWSEPKWVSIAQLNAATKGDES